VTKRKPTTTGTPTGPRWERVPTGREREQFSIRLTPGQLLAVQRLGKSVSETVRRLVQKSLNGAAWPRFVDGASDEGAAAWVQVRISPELRAMIGEYQQASGCRDMSAAVRSLVTSALAVEG
jgi:hypothetical protein